MPSTDKIIKNAKETDAFLESSIKNHQRRLADAITTLENRIVDLTKEFKSSDGSLLGPRVNLKLAQKVA